MPHLNKTAFYVTIARTATAPAAIVAIINALIDWEICLSAILYAPYRAQYSMHTKHAEKKGILMLYSAFPLKLSSISSNLTLNLACISG